MADLHKRGSYTFYDKDGMLEYFVSDGVLSIDSIEHDLEANTTTLKVTIVEFKEEEADGELQDPEA